MTNKWLKYASLKKLSYIVLALVLVFSCLNLAYPKKAYAYQIPKINSWKTVINAEISTNGSINVSEHRIIDVTKFIEKAKKYRPDPNDTSPSINQSAKYSPLVWNFNSFPDATNISISDAKIAIINNNDDVFGTWTNLPYSSFLSKWHGNDGPNSQMFTYDEELKQICLFSALTNENECTEKQAYEIMTQMTQVPDPALWNTTKAVINLNYSINCAPMVYKDVADFQWIYITDTWSADSYNVDLNVTIPVGSASIANPLGKVTNLDQPNTEATTERNIYAWGHGSSSGVVNLNPNGLVTINNEIVPGGTDASLRIVFPAAWLTNLDKNADITQQNQTKLTSILKDEFVWRDWRTENVSKLIVPIIYISLCALVLIIVLIIAISLKRKFSNKAVASANLADMHPCVLIRLKNWNHQHEHDIVASILHMNEKKLIKIEKLHSGDFVIKLKNKNIAKDPYSNKKIDIIDVRTINFLFKECAKGAYKISLQDIENFAAARSYDFISYYLTWHSLLTDQVNKIIDLKSSYDRPRHILYGLGFGIFILSAILGLCFKEWITPVCGLFTGIVVCFVANSLRNKYYFADENGKKIEVSKIQIGLAEYTKLVAQFKDQAIEVIRKSVLKAQDLISKFNLTN